MLYRVVFIYFYGGGGGYLTSPEQIKHELADSSGSQGLKIIRHSFVIQKNVNLLFVFGVRIKKRNTNQ